MTSAAEKQSQNPTGVVCFGGEDWWYHNHGHMDIQIMKRFASETPVLYVNSIVMKTQRA